jgi:hypothetical protein
VSDGPFMSPPVKRCWQPVAERAALESFSLQELREAVRPALLAEGRGLPKDFLKRATETVHPRPEAELWSPLESGGVEALRRAADGHPLALAIIDSIDDALASNQPDDTVLVDAIATALRQCWDENARALEEHAQREAVEIGIAKLVRERLEKVCPDATTLTDMARALLKLEGASSDRAAPKRVDLEDGPALIDTDDER